MIVLTLIITVAIFSNYFPSLHYLEPEMSMLILSIINTLKEIGITISLDDFGTGYLASM